MRQRSRKDWGNYLKAVAGSAPDLTRDASLALLESFADESGHRRRTDRPLLAHVLDIPPGKPPALNTGDEHLWWALHDPASSPTEHVHAGEGPLLPELGSQSIEMRTEAELSALHAWWLHAQRQSNQSWRARALSAADWLLKNLQPDNATAHPWAAQVFIEAALSGDLPDAGMYADTLIHNCRVNLGHPDALSRWILRSAAKSLGACKDVPGHAGARSV